MSKISVVYWSQSGNTEMMAEAIGKGIQEGGKEAEILSVGEVSADSLKDARVFALGCPAMGDEVLEEDEMEPFVAEVESFVSGKNIALFGSYGWGDGQWMREWTERMTNAGAKVINGEGLMCQEEPDDEAIAACISLGRQMASME